MRNLSHIASVYFIGIGGIGMSALARCFLSQGKKVYGYDKTPSAITDGLIAQGAQIVFLDEIALIPAAFQKHFEQNLVIYTPAIPRGAAIKKYLEGKGYELLKRAKVLGLIAEEYFTIAVAGTHGKTTTSSMIAHIVAQEGFEMMGILGGIATNFKSNYIHQKTGKLFNGKPILVTEADEFDRSFLNLNPDIAVITSTDADHLDIYSTDDAIKESFQQFANLVKGQLVVQSDVAINHSNKYRYGQAAEHKFSNIQSKDGFQLFDIEIGAKHIKHVKAGLPGKHNIENALAAAVVSNLLDISEDKIAKHIASFKGVKRRFEKVFESTDYTVIDDYAHHPSELDALINAIKQLYPNRAITMLFQPHLFSRTRDFMDGFAKSLSQVDELVLLPIYPARELPIDGIDSEVLMSKITVTKKQILPREKVVDYLKLALPSLLVIAGAGDIDRIVAPIKELYIND